MKKANIVSVKKVEEKNAVKVSDSLDFCHQSSQFFVSLISNYHLSHKFLRKVSSFQGDRGERGPKGNDGMNGLKVGVEISY